MRDDLGLVPPTYSTLTHKHHIGERKHRLTWEAGGGLTVLKEAEVILPSWLGGGVNSCLAAGLVSTVRFGLDTGTKTLGDPLLRRDRNL
jgi:hypothetical protein